MTAPASVSLNDAIARIALGDRAAFRQVYAASSARLFAVCLRLMRNREEAEDVLQEAFVKVWERSHLYDARKGEALAWLVTIARHCALDRLRKPGRNAAPFDETAAAEWDRQALHEPEQPAASGALQRCLGGLREDYRNVVVLAYVDGLTHEELAARFGKPVGTVKSWVRRGLTQLKDCMAQ
jgi:RNA polymerase sigma-70 factor (ECF subfamily)